MKNFDRGEIVSEAVLPIVQLTSVHLDDAMRERACAHALAVNACASLITVKLIENHANSNLRSPINRRFDEWLASKPVDAVLDAETMSCLYQHMPEFNIEDCLAILGAVSEGLRSRSVDLGELKLEFSRSFVRTHTSASQY
jgi:hypothetical protein